MRWTPPTAEDQILLLRRLQRLLNEGAFTSTYKYALLHALADLAVVRGDDSGAPLELTTREIAETMIGLYWRQAAPFPVPGGERPLRQNTNGEAVIVTRLRTVQERTGVTLPQFRQDARRWTALVRAVEDTVRQMPLWRLQTIGSERLEFLYRSAGADATIALLPGVAYCLRAFHPLVTELVRSAWMRFVRRRNLAALDQAADLSAFLFGAERAPLGVYQGILRDIQAGCCFYCRCPLRDTGAVDHFVPWSRYPVDLAHNFVLAHQKCNAQKADHLAAEKHLAAWLERNTDHAGQLGGRFEQLGVAHDAAASHRIAAWAYGQTARAGGQVWVDGATLQPLGPHWARLFAA